MKEFEFLEHTADVYIVAYGEDLPTTFENAAKAMFEVMTDTSKVSPKVKRFVSVDGFDLFSLLYSWLEELIYIFEVEHLFLSKFKVLEIVGADDGYMLNGEVYGEPVDVKRHIIKIGVKAVTYSQMEIVDRPGNCVVKFVLDV